VRLSLEERVEAFHRSFPTASRLIIHNGVIYGVWKVGASYSSKMKRGVGYYGSFPAGVLERLLALFPDCKRRLYLFSGTINDLDSITYDINPEVNPTICDDVSNLKKHEQYFRSVDLVIADPPYEKKDFEKYGVKPINKARVISDVGEVVNPGTFLAWLDLFYPLYDSKVWGLVAQIAVIIGTGRRVRLWTVFEKR
jgi:hypothetical protein